MADPKPITIRGVTYGSHGAAARDLGVTRAAIFLARQRGTLESVGAGATSASPVKIRGKVYPSGYAAARELGLCKSTIYNALEKGTLDRVELRKMKGKKL